jgi:DNA modification methylase
VPGIVLDPFIGSGTTALVALKLGRKYLGIELNPEYIKIAERRLSKMGLFA